MHHEARLMPRRTISRVQEALLNVLYRGHEQYSLGNAP